MALAAKAAVTCSGRVVSSIERLVSNSRLNGVVLLPQVGGSDGLGSYRTTRGTALIKSGGQ